MMKLMIVEDDPRILHSLSSGIPWARHGIRVSAIAEDGTEALALAERETPDLMLLDIGLPGMDGLSLASAVLQRAPLARIAVLSGHDEIRYAQQAMELGIMKYLLKPANRHTILQAMLALAEETRRARAAAERQAELQRLWRSRLPQLRQDFLRDWMAGRYAAWELVRHARELGLALLEDARYVAGACRIDPLPDTQARFGAGDRPLLHAMLLSIAKECLAQDDCHVFDTDEETTVVLFAGLPGETDAALQERMGLAIRRLLAAVRACLKLTASAGLGTAQPLTAAPHSYRDACRALQERTVCGQGATIAYRRRATPPTGGLVPCDPAFERRLEIAVYRADAAAAHALLDGYVARAFAQADCAELAYEQVLFLSGVFTRLLQSQGWSVQQVLAEDYAYFLALETLVSQAQIAQWASRVTARIVEHAGRTRASGGHRMVGRLLEMIERTPGADLSLHALAARLYVNASYLSRLFKKEVGQPFSDYVLARRMERAKELLLGEAKVNDVASAVGYRDISYFAKAFRKYWGVAPSALRHK
ncbi:response regulator [Paenibacillus sp. IB182496]|uniref:Response regulator n=1 Tax=Paenibacillus sabuli TaxID=2772509 RepID=A0A927BSY4_9BACL|nr:response regulator [Paenibacillus sabuli]MBD2844853.1 response regulator [Paenibacillus sabuli]